MYRETERRRACQSRDKVFRDRGGGLYNGKPRDFVLADPRLNLWGGIRDDAIDYFTTGSIVWHKGSQGLPTGHLLSSQVACINHLFFARQRKDVATAILEGIRPDIKEALIVDDGFVEFEFIGQDRYLMEKGWARGANCTSVDAAMLGMTDKGKTILFLIEWKYTEYYPVKNLKLEARSRIYDPFLIDPVNSPFIQPLDTDAMYYEPFYQMMRQTLLGSLCVKHRDHGCDDYMHVHVIPEGNLELRNNVTSPNLPGPDITQAWTRILKNPDKYCCVTPEDLLIPCRGLKDLKTVFGYLERRYW